MRSSCRCRRCTRERRGQSASSFGLGKREFLAKLNLKQLLNYRRQFRSHQLQALSLSLSLHVCVCACVLWRTGTPHPFGGHTAAFSLSLAAKKIPKIQKIYRTMRTNIQNMKKEKKATLPNMTQSGYSCTCVYVCVCVQEYSHTQARTHTHSYCTLNLGSFSFVCLN